MAKKSTPTPPSPTLKVTNFGPIAEAEVELRPLTVFVGPSNTGKTYLATLLYVLCRAFSSGGAGNEQMELFFKWRHNENAGKQLIKKLQKLLLKAKDADVKAHANKLENEIFSFIQGDSLDVKDMIEEYLCFCFGFSKAKNLISRAKKKAHIDLVIPQDNQGNDLVHQIEIEGKSSSHEFKLLGEIPSEKMKKIAKAIQNANQKASADNFSYSFYKALDDFYTACHKDIPGRTYYLPAGRTGAMRSLDAVASNLIQSAAIAGGQYGRSFPILSGVYANLMSELIAIGSAQERENCYADLVEKNILKGKILRESVNHTSYPAFFYRPDGWKDVLSLAQTSSMVSELAPVVLYLRHIVVEGNMLIIDEPEAHLHPEVQAKLACELARLVKNGYRIVLTTHSEWLLDQFSNLVRLSELPGKEKKKHPHAEFALDASQFGAWLFGEKKRSKGSVVRELSVDPDVDGLTADYSELAMNLYNEWAEIGNVLADRGGK